MIDGSRFGLIVVGRVTKHEWKMIGDNKSANNEVESGGAVSHV